MTVQMYQEKAKTNDPQIFDIPSFMREFFPEECASIVDIYCDPPFDGWKDMASHEDLPLKYYFAMGCHPHNAKRYNDAVENIILEAMRHPYHPQPPVVVCLGSDVVENVLRGVKWDWIIIITCLLKMFNRRSL